MTRFFSRALLVSCLSITAAACSNNNTLTGGTTTPTSPLQNETFSGTLTLNGAVTHPFTAAAAGLVSATLSTLTSDVTGLTVSLSIGTWNGQQCQIILANDKAVQGTTVTGNVSTTSQLCVRIADATGAVPGPTPYVITVSHP